jgi:hypothetical protein
MPTHEMSALKMSNSSKKTFRRDPSKVSKLYIFKPKIPIWLNFGGYYLELKMCVPILYGQLEYFMAIWYILCPFGIFNGHLVYFMAIWCILCPFGNLIVLWYIFPSFRILFEEKSGNPVPWLS